jgi:uncharacterized membrane protein
MKKPAGYWLLFLAVVASILAVVLSVLDRDGASLATGVALVAGAILVIRVARDRR